MSTPKLLRARSEPILGTVNQASASEGPVASLRGAAATLSMPKFEQNTTTPSPDQSQGFPHKQTNSPNLEWHKGRAAGTWANGRVLLIDYIGSGYTATGRRKIVSQEFSDLEGLERCYNEKKLAEQTILRVMHVQNAPWAWLFLSRKLNIDRSDSMDMLSGALPRHERPQQEDVVPNLKAKSFQTKRHSRRGIKTAAFGCDYLKHHPKSARNTMCPMFEISHYDKTDQPVHGYDVYSQRLSVYIQSNYGEPSDEEDSDMSEPDSETEAQEYQKLEEKRRKQRTNEEENLYNGSTIIIFEGSGSGSVKDTLVGARRKLESRWRRLAFYLPKDVASTDRGLATECMRIIVEDVFKALIYNWDHFMSVCDTHVGILEEKVYRNPADESRATELWKNSAQWMKFGRLLYLHANVSTTMRKQLQDLASSDLSDSESWLGSVPDEMERLLGEWDRNVVQRTAALSELMFKSVAFRDARDSLQLGVSMWRLSWITFIFLPLTFTVGFFGMNVDTFESNPSIKWWFITAIAVLILVVISWYAIKHSLSSTRKAPLRRGVYEAMYRDFASHHPALWTLGGPKFDVMPGSRLDLVKWRLITTWFGADKLKPGPSYDPVTEDFGAWSDTKRWLARLWLSQLSDGANMAKPHDA